MNLPPCSRWSRDSGYALILVMGFLGVSLVILTGVLSWTSTNVRLNQRNNQYFDAVAAAEAATEKVVAHLAADFKQSGESLVYHRLPHYRELVPDASEDPLWQTFEFTDASGSVDQTFVTRTAGESYVELESEYRGLRGFAASYRVVSNARDSSSPQRVVGAVRQDLQVATIPIFQFAIFYSVTLEINPGPPMVVDGRVHSNADLYAQPVSSLTFLSDVTSSGRIIHNKHPHDPSNRGTGGSVAYEAAHDQGVSALTLPIGSDNSPATVHGIIEIPPGGEDPKSPMGQERYFNKADLHVLVSSAGVTVKSGSRLPHNIVISWNEASNFVSPDVVFFDKREDKQVIATEIDIGQLRQWSGTNTSIASVLKGEVQIVYVADSRPETSSAFPAVRLVNGQALPANGLTVATPHPLYVKGHYNAPPAQLGTPNTSATRPASLVADSITLLSPDWEDSNSGSALGHRRATHTTVNAAFLAGNTPTVNGTYSGGVENFPRFLENWSGRVLTYNGSMVVLFHSHTASAPWGRANVYNPPNRNWAFDKNFLDPTKLPPGTPGIRAIIRADWATVPPETTDI